MKAIGLVWYCKTPRGWRRFPAITTKEHGQRTVLHGWVKDGKEQVQYPDGRYQLRMWESGLPVYQNIDTCHPRDAYKAWEKAIKVAAPASNAPKIANIGLLKHAATAYVKDRKEARKMEAAGISRLVLDEFLNVCPVTYSRQVTRECVLNFHAALRKKGNSERTIANKHARLKSFLKWLKLDTKWMPPAPDYEESLPDIYSQAELAAVREAANEYMRVAIDLAYMLGLREQELMFAEWSDVNWDHATFRVQAKKGDDWEYMPKDKEQRDLAIPAVLLQRLKQHREGQPDRTRLILATENGTPNTHLLRTLKRMTQKAGLNCGNCDSCKKRSKSKKGTRKAVNAPGKLVYRKADPDTGQECKKWTLHRFRRTCLTTMLRSGIDARTVQRFAGHSSLETTLRYLSPASTSEMQDKMNAIFAD